jgi:hypothetical protein
VKWELFQQSFITRSQLFLVERGKRGPTIQFICHSPQALHLLQFLKALIRKVELKTLLYGFFDCSSKYNILKSAPIVVDGLKLTV